MTHALVEHGVNVIIGEGVQDVASIATEFDEVRLLERSQLMGDRGLRRFGGLGDIGNAELAAHEGVEDLDARGVAKNLKQVCKIVEELLIGKVFGGAVGRRSRKIKLFEFLRDFLFQDAHLNILSYEHALISIDDFII